MAEWRNRYWDCLLAKGVSERVGEWVVLLG